MLRPVLVTGAAGFIGSHLTDRLLEQGYRVVGFDNLSAGSRSNLARAMKNTRFEFVEGDLLDFDATRQVLRECDLVYHLAADPEVRIGAEHPEVHFKQNLFATHNLLEAIRERGNQTRLIFASTSTIYGEPTVIPTPENYGPLLPISSYGATKLGCEALAVSYAHFLPFQTVIYRFANVVGTRARHGVVYDFITKLLGDHRELEVLGDGTQTKSYLHIDDCIDALLMTLDDGFWRSPAEIYNIGTEDQTNVLRIAQIVTEALGFGKVPIRTTQPIGGRAWPGDVQKMLLDISKIRKTGWRPERNSEDAVRSAADGLIREIRQAN